MKIIFVEFDSELAVLDMDTISSVDITALLDHGCHCYKVLHPKYLFDLYKKSRRAEELKDKNICILIDEEGKINNHKENDLISYICNIKENSFIRDIKYGNALIVGERVDKSGEVEFCGLDDCMGIEELNDFISELEILNEWICEVQSSSNDGEMLVPKLAW